MDKIKPIKRFGQNYLKDQNILNKLVREINPQKEDAIIEIGPGLGALTDKIHSLVDNFTAVEIDKRVLEELQSKYPKLNLISKDFLKINIEEFFNQEKKKLRFIGNIPYYLTSPILFKLIENNNLVEDAVLMIQLEVAQRLTAKKNTKDYGILAVLLQFFADVKLSFKVSPNVFYPKPKVYSSVIHIYFKNLRIDEELKGTFIKIVKAAFGKRRKTLKNSLSNSTFGELDFSDCGIDLSKRPEQLEKEEFFRLAKFAHSKISQMKEKK